MPMIKSTTAVQKAVNAVFPSVHAADAHGTTSQYATASEQDPRAEANDENLEEHEPDSVLDEEKRAYRYGPPALDHGPGVNVAQAEEDFTKLQQTISNYSQNSQLQRQRSRSQSRSRKSGKPTDIDIEKTATRSSDDGAKEPFDLEGHLRGSRQMEEEAGIKDKHIGVIWDDLTVSGIGGAKTFARTFPDAFVSFFNVFGTAMSILGLAKKGEQVDILKDFKGVVKPGEMVLVLGKPGSGCTSFLKVIANQRFGYTRVLGDVLYGPYDAATFSKRYRGEAVYNMEEDVHHPTLTVAQTLGFALDCKTPGKRPGGMSAAEFKDRVIDTLLKMFNIEHTKNTIVGNPFVRGVSGGERKRVSIAEMMICGACVNAWDNTTRGLDASTALDYVKSLRILTNVYKTTTFVSLYQASETIYEQFDKVMVIDQGRQVFFGPATAARAYFESLGFRSRPRQTTPDYLTGCTDPFEREYQSGRDETNAPGTAEQLEKAFQASIIHQDLVEEMSRYRKTIVEEQDRYNDFQQAVHEGKRHVKRGVYSIPLYMQVWALMRRQFFLKWQDKFGLFMSWLTTLVIAIVLGTVWLNLPETSAGAFTRGGVLFLSLLFNAFQAFSELVGIVLGRNLVNKHRAFTFHRPAALWLAQICVDLVFAAARILAFSLIVYFMCGLARTPGAFFTFVLIIITGYLSMALFFRCLGCLCPDFDYAIKFASAILTLFVITAGYQIGYQDQQVWLRWIFYVNVMGLGFSSLMNNEFKRLNLTCTAESLIPSGPGYTDINNQVCTLQGSQPGNPIVSGSSYIGKTFEYYPSDQWRNWGIMVVLVGVFLVCNAFFSEIVNWGAGGKTVTIYTKENDERRELNKELAAKKDLRLRRQAKETTTADLNITSKAVLTWENLCYDVPIPSGQIRLLRDVYGYVKPGQLTALMGASGAGKTTLLDVLASRKNIGVISGERLVDGIPPGTAFQRGTSYAEQLDVHEQTATVREALRFSADLRQPFHVAQSEKYAYVEDIISLLEMEELADAIIGNPDSGLTVEQRKRVTIGVELAAKPELLLFLDEPTSGLDSQSAFNIVRFLKKLANAGQAILCTIHQPNSGLFESFDRLLLLQRGGETIYFGNIGKDACTLRDYFARNGAICPPKANPAEWMLDAIGAGQAARIGDRDWADIWRASPELDAVKSEIASIKQARLEAADSPVHQVGAIVEQEYATPLWHQIRIVCARTNLAFWRQPNYGFTRLFNHVVTALITGLAFLQLNLSRASLQYRIFLLFQVTVLPVLILAQVEPKYDLSRLIFYRESAAKAYRQFPFALSMVVAEVPYSLLCAVGFFLPLYYIPGFNPASSRAGYQFLMILITEFFAVTLGQTIAALTPSSFISALVNPFVIIIFALFCGVTIPYPQIPGFWRAWLYQLDPFTRLIGGMVVTELHDLPVQCLPSELNVFPTPTGMSCGTYMAPFFAAGGAGYIVDNSTMGECAYCAYKVGDQFFTPLGLEFGNRWRDLGILAAFIGSNLVLLFVGSRYLNFNRR